MRKRAVSTGDDSALSRVFLQRLSQYKQVLCLEPKQALHRLILATVDLRAPINIAQAYSLYREREVTGWKPILLLGCSERVRPLDALRIIISVWSTHPTAYSPFSEIRDVADGFEGHRDFRRPANFRTSPIFPLC